MRLIIVVLGFLLLSNNIANAIEGKKQYIKTANTKVIDRTDSPEELKSMKVQLQSLIATPKLFAENSNAKLRRRPGGQSASVAILGTYRLNDETESSSLFLDIVDAEIKDGNGPVEVVLNDSNGFILEHTVGALINNRLVFQRIFLNGGQLYLFNLNPKQSYSGPGASIIEFISDDCFDESGDGFIEIGEYYACQLTEPAIGTAEASLTRLN